jgi:hypothetical protein
MLDTRFWRDANERLTFIVPDVSAVGYPSMCRAIVDVFALTQDGELVIGPDQMFWNWRRGEHVIGLDWDIWMGFMLVAKSTASESLVHEVAIWLCENSSALAKDRE